MSISPVAIFSISLAFCVVVLLAEAAYLLLTRNTDKKSRINRRMRVSEDDGGIETRYPGPASQGTRHG